MKIIQKVDKKWVKKSDILNINTVGRDSTVSALNDMLLGVIRDMPEIKELPPHMYGIIVDKVNECSQTIADTLIEWSGRF